MILYQCDECGQVVNTAEALGPGVIEELDNQGYVQGRTFEYKVPDNTSPDLTLILQLTDVSGKGQFCYACMWKALAQLVDERGPEGLLTTLALNIMKQSASKVLMEVPNDGPADGTTVSDNELREMYAEGHLPETGSDTGEEEPGSED